MGTHHLNARSRNEKAPTVRRKSSARTEHTTFQAFRCKRRNRFCLGPIILSPVNGPVKMSPHEPGDITLESERVATSGCNFVVHSRNPDVCQSRGAARPNGEACQTSQIALSARQ